MSELRGKLALVTGGAHGVGKAITTALLERGADVIVNYFHSHEAAKETARELGPLGRVELLRGSVARSDQVTRMFAEIEQRFGRLDILVNNAASGALVPDDEVTDEQLDLGWDTNVKGALRCSQHAAELMRRQGRGAIVNISALGGSQFVMANYLACAPAKAAMETMTRYLAARYAAAGIRVNTASAAMLVSDVADAFPQAAAMQRAIGAATPLGRLGTPAEFADLVAFLASEQARWITGQTVLADGGLSLGVPLLSAPGELASATTVPGQAAATMDTEPVPSASGAGARPVAEASVCEPHDCAAGVDTRFEAETPVTEPEDDEIAIVGIGMAVAGANSPEEFWQLRNTGADLFVPVPVDRWERDSFHSTDDSAEDKAYQDRCVFITEFAPTEGGFDPADPAGNHEFTTSWLRHSVIQAMRGVGTRPTDRFRAVIGYTPDGNQHLEEAGVLAAAVDRADSILAELAPAARDFLRAEVAGTLGARYRRGAGDNVARFLPHRVGRLAIDGVLPAATTVQMVDTACSSSLYAVDIGAKALLDGAVDLAVCGGAFALGPRGTVLFSKLRGLSKKGEVRSLDRDADGVIFADGAAVVVLKRLSRARADGDDVLGVLRSTGTSSDGKGKAIYAPNPKGQARAISRARETDPPIPVDWIIAHATGTPAGDTAELKTLHESYGAEAIPVTSNKSLIGHTGWAAGVVSLIEATLGLRHGVVPPQFRFTAPPVDFPADRSRLTIPTEALALPARQDRPRTVAVTGFGFGGTNAHLLLSEQHPAAVPTKTASQRRDGRIAIVGWAAHLPGLADRTAIEAWLRGTGPGPADSFGEKYPTPTFDKVRLPPPTVRTVDRCQLMILECGHQLREQLGDSWQDHADRTGVFVGNLGPTRAGMLYANRCYLDDISGALYRNPRLAESELLPKLLDGLSEHAQRLVPPSNEDSFSGIMPNIISARLANYFDLHGPNLTLDAGLASTLSAFDVACQYLRAGDIDVALAGGINGNDLAELRPLLAELLPDTAPADGAFLFALATEEVAVASGMPILAIVDEIGVVDESAKSAAAEVECGVPAPATARYLGAAGGLEVLRLLLTGGGSADVVCHGEPDTPATRIGLTIPATEAPPLPERFSSPDAYGPGAACKVRRHVPELVPVPADAIRPALPFLPAGVVLLTDDPELVAALGPLPDDAIVLCATPDTTSDTVDAALAGRAPKDVRVLVDLAASAPVANCLTEGAPAVEALHDLLFLVLRRAEHASVFALLLGGLHREVPHPFSGLFTGLMKAAQLEAPDTERFALVTTTQDVTAGALLVEAETRRNRVLPVVFDRSGTRCAYTLVERNLDLAETGPRLSASSVVVAVGGARGITAELVKALAADFGPKLYLLGSNPLDDYPAETFIATDAEFAAGRKHWLRDQLTTRPGTPVATLNREFNRMLDARAARGNIDAMASLCGAARVRYLTCDVTDEVSVRRAIGEILATESSIDLLINAAGKNSSALLPRKDFAAFRSVRDLKLRSHRNLKKALADTPVGLWCSFGSLLGFFGQRGESDYAAGNDFLATASEFAARVQGRDEVTIGWTLWSGTGMGAGDLISKYYERADSYSNMAVAEGIHHFVRELHAAERVPHIVHLGAAERRTVTSFYPEFFTGTTRTGDHHLRHTVSRTEGTAVYECPMTEQADGYLYGHTVRGHATLPGLFVTEIAAEAALSLRPELVVIGFEDLVFERFVQVRPDLDVPPKRIHASVGTATADLVTIDVRITSDIVAPTGLVIAKDKPHFTCRVLLAPAANAALRWQDWTTDPAERAVPDPYHLPGSPVRLSGPFVCTTDTRTHPRGARARFRPDLTDADPVWSKFLMPSLLLDGMARMGALHPTKAGLLPVAVPTSVRRIDLYQQANDVELAQAGPLELYATPAEFTLDGPAANRFVAARPDGGVVAQIKDIGAKVLGYVDPADGTFHTSGETHG
ncbi:SDR family oxidoreductase [Nocardia sp. NPDC052316]|uniref:SDR family oxidoreductase n=1 Tax=Nocardia sp. NPDC052316 TaxID=3364329 RepID=UPI0037CC2006